MRNRRIPRIVIRLRRVGNVRGILLLLLAAPAAPTDPLQAQVVYLDSAQVGQTYWDQGLAGTGRRRIAQDPSGRVHTSWTNRPDNDFDPWAVVYNSYLAPDVEHGVSGCTTGTGGGDACLGIHNTTPAIVHSASGVPGYPAIDEKVGPGCDWSQYTFVSFSGGSYPDFAVQTAFSAPFYHLLARSTRDLVQGLMYWRTPLGGQGRVVEPLPVGENGEFALAVSPVSARVAITFIKYDIVYYYESADSGRTWGGGSGFGVRHSIGVPDAGYCITAAYDHDDVLHIVFGGPPGTGTELTLRHWSAPTGVTEVYAALWQLPGIVSAGRNIMGPQLAVGRGDFLNNLYLVWSQLGGPGNFSDYSDSGFVNGDVYMAISEDGGDNWSLPINLTNTTSPGCNGDCRSEILASVAPVVDSVIYLTYVVDLEAGPYYDFDSGIRHQLTSNPVVCAKIAIPAPPSAPAISGLPSGIGTLYFGVDRTDTTTAQIGNVGTEDLTYAIYDTLPWLGMGGDSDSAGTIVAGSGDTRVLSFIVDASLLPDGWHDGEFFVVSNDPLVNGSLITVSVLISANVVGAFRFGSSAGTECWGWVDDAGREYAIMGIDQGIVIVDATNLRVIDTVSGPGPCGFSWRDIKTYRHYAYAVSECSGTNQGLMIMDLQYLPDSVHFVGSYAPAGKVTSHNMSMDTATGHAYLITESLDGFRVVSLASPESPVDVGMVDLAGTGCHDIVARNDTVWAAEAGGGRFSVWNAANKNAIANIAAVTIPSAGYAHNVWPSADGRFVATTEETTAKTVKIWNVQDLQNIQLAGQYLAPCQLAHNAHFEDSFVVISHYESGVRVLHISAAGVPTEIGQFDTHPLDESPNFAGCWGVYPHTPSGRLYASNIDGHLFILQFPELLSACLCDCHADPLCDGVGVDVQDVIATIDAAFRGQPPGQTVDCPAENSDVDCSGVTDILDVIAVIDVAFRGAESAARFCDPCAP